MFSQIKKIFIMFFVLSFCSSLFAKENGEVFLSLTRKLTSMKDSPTNVSVITETKIIEQNPKNLGEILENEVGLITGEYGTLGATQNMMLRGSSPEQVLILIDGRRINDPSSGLVNLSNIPVDNIKKIEIIRGGASAIYGSSALGGVVNIITKQAKDETPNISLNISGGSFDTYNYGLNFNVKKRKTSCLVTANKTNVNGWRQNSDYDNNNFFTRLGFDLEEFGKIDFSGSFFRSELGVPGTGISLDLYDGSTEKLAFSPDARQQEKRIFSRLEHFKEWDNLSLKSIFHILDNTSKYKDPMWFTDDEHKSLTFGTELQFTNSFGTIFGIEWWEEDYQQLDNINYITKVDQSRVTSALYIQHEFNLDKFGVIPSVRYDNNSKFSGVFSPRITVLYKPHNNWKLSSNVGKSWRAPTFNELYWPYQDFGTDIYYGNISLKPEEGITSDIGIEYSKNTFKSAVTFFLTETKDLIAWKNTFDPDLNADVWNPQNIGKSRQQGFEFELKQNLFLTGLYHKVNYTYLWAEDLENKKLLNYRPPNKVNYELTYMTLWDLTASLDLQYVSAQDTWDSFAPIISSLPEYTLLGLKLSQKIFDTEVWFKIDNITDEKYQTRLNYPLPGRAFYGGISIKFWN